MQHSLKLLILLAAIGFPALAFADLAGLDAPLAVTAEFGLFVYGSAFTLLFAFRDYSRVPRNLRLPSPLLLPASEAFAHAGAVSKRPAARRSFRAVQLS